MKRTLCAGVLALAISGFLSTVPAAYASDVASTASDQAPATSIDVGRIKSVLRLTSEQEPYWPPVEAALRDIARQQAQVEPAGLVRRIGRRMVAIVLNSAAVERLAVAARPLIAKLDQEQMRAAGGMAQEMGLGPVVMAALR